MVAFGEVEEFSRELAREFKPDRIVLFGSQAAQQGTEASDVDLLVTMNYSGSRLQTAAQIIRKLRPRFALDLVIRTEAEVAERIQQHDSFLSEKVQTGRVLYEAVD